ncbi:MAG: Sec-independent protein translocase protein TatB [Burkholderiaceae bacterium]
MFDIGFSELLVIGVVALIVLGPERLPKVARTVGQWLGKAQRYVNDVKADIAREGELAELKKLKSEVETAARDMQTDMTAAANSINAEVNSAAQSVTNDYAALSDNPTALAQTVAAAAPEVKLADAAVDPFAPLPEPPIDPPAEGQAQPPGFKDPAHDVSVQRMEAEILVDEIAKLEARLEQLKRNAEAARNMAA